MLELAIELIEFTVCLSKVVEFLGSTACTVRVAESLFKNFKDLFEVSNLRDT